MTATRLVVIGGDAAGMTAQQLADLDLSLRPTLLSGLGSCADGRPTVAEQRRMKNQ